MTLNYGTYGIFLIMGNAGVCPSTVSRIFYNLGPVTSALLLSSVLARHASSAALMAVRSSLVPIKT